MIRLADISSEIHCEEYALYLLNNLKLETNITDIDSDESRKFFISTFILPLIKNLNKFIPELTNLESMLMFKN